MTPISGRNGIELIEQITGSTGDLLSPDPCTVCSMMPHAYEHPNMKYRETDNRPSEAETKSASNGAFKVGIELVAIGIAGPCANR